MNEELLQFELYKKEHDDAIKALAMKIHEDIKLYCRTYWQLHRSVDRYKKLLNFRGMKNVADALSEIYENELKGIEIQPRERIEQVRCTNEGEEYAEEKEDI